MVSALNQSVHSFLVRKKNRGIRPIAVGGTLRWLVAKIAGGKVMERMDLLLSPRQFSYGVRNGAEAAVHAARCYLQKADSSSVVVKLDFSNAFNFIRRDRMLKSVQRLVPVLSDFVHSAYSAPSTLSWGAPGFC